MKKHFFLLALTLALLACEKQEASLGKNEFYTCSMDPQVMEKKPGHCPICKMELTKVTIDPHQSGLRLSEEQMELANISLSKAEYGWIGNEKIVTAEIVDNENLKSSISARISGRVQHLYFKNLGEKIHKGSLLYEVYSEELLTVEKDYLLAKEQAKAGMNGAVNYQELASASRTKLSLWGLTESQIDRLDDKSLSPLVPIYSTEEGLITSVEIREGEYVMEGARIFEISDYSSVWIEAQVYPDELGNLSEREEVEVRVAGFTDQVLKGPISFINPQLQTQSKINLVRMEIQNPSGQFRPGMQAFIFLKQERRKALLISSSSVLQDSKGASVWIRSEAGRFELKMVEIGLQSMDKVEIVKGLKEGDEVVNSGAYLINSEYVFKKGADPMEGHKM
jgi:Cu(I)/Ag(I) efflux system membrane fusion protein